MITLATSADTFTVKNDTEEIELIRWCFDQKEYEYMTIEECHYSPENSFGYRDLIAEANELALARDYGYENGEIPIYDIVDNPQFVIDIAVFLSNYPLLDDGIYSELETDILDEYVLKLPENNRELFYQFYLDGMANVTNSGEIDYFEHDFSDYVAEQRKN